MVTLLTASIVAATAALAPPQDTSGAQARNYENMTLGEWQSFSGEARRELFVRFSPAKRAEIVRAHLSSWRDEHANDLNAAQVEVIEEALQLATPVAYDAPAPGAPADSGDSARRAELKARTKSLQSKAEGVFTPEDIQELFFLQFDPKPRPR